jgi:hypothetical protein
MRDNAMTPEVRNIVLGLVLACLCLGWLARDAWAESYAQPNAQLYAQDCEYGQFGCGHHENHEEYLKWKTPQGGSCCNGKDCRPVRAKQDHTGAWLIYIPELKDTSHDPWVLVPPAALQSPDRFKDGRSHACTADPANWSRYFQYNPTLPVYCFSPAQVKG